MAAVVIQRPFSCFTENRAPVSSIAVRPGSPQRRRRKVLARKPQPAAQRRDRVSTPCACEKRRVKVAQEGDGLGKAWKPRKSVWITAARRRADRPPGCAQPPEACVSRTRNGEEMGSPSGRACPGSAAQAAYRRAHMRHPKDRAGQASVGKRLARGRPVPVQRGSALNVITACIPEQLPDQNGPPPPHPPTPPKQQSPHPDEA